MNKLYDFLRGRYGADELSWATVILGILFMIIFSFMEVWLVLIPLALFAVAVYRILSKNIKARQRENEIFCELIVAPINFVKLTKNKIRDRETHVYFKCPSCGRVLRVPRGKGEIKVTCPICNNTCSKRT